MSNVASSFDLIKAFKKKDFAPIYLFHGEEDYFIDELAHSLEEHALEESEKAFNQMVVYGRDTTPGNLRDIASRLPMMAPRQVVIVREAQDLKDIDELTSYALKPVPSSVLVLCYKHKKLDGRSKLFKAINEHGLIFESKRLYDNKIPDWIRTYLKEKSFDISPEALNLATEYLGNQVSTITNELLKVMVPLAPGQRIELEHIQDAIGISRDFNVFELHKAVGSRQNAQAFYILYHMIQDIKTNPPVVVISSLASFFTKIYMYHHMHGAKESELLSALGLKNNFFLKDYQQAARYYLPHHIEYIFGLLHDFDMRSKGVGSRDTEDGELLRELIHGILNS